MLQRLCSIFDFIRWGWQRFFHDISSAQDYSWHVARLCRVVNIYFYFLANLQVIRKYERGWSSWARRSCTFWIWVMGWINIVGLAMIIMGWILINELSLLGWPSSQTFEFVNLATCSRPYHVQVPRGQASSEECSTLVLYAFASLLHHISSVGLMPSMALLVSKGVHGPAEL